jgi:uncharacterized membrane protein YgaE (UPF0421/DUF939 family)
MGQLADKVTSMHEQQYDLAETIKIKERRLATLDRHLEQAAIYHQTKVIYRKYSQLDPKKRHAFKEKHATSLGQCETAHKYLTDHLNGRTVIPEKAWKAEREKLLSERYAHMEQYYQLKDDVRSVEILRRSAERIMDESATEQPPEKKRDILR